MNIEDRELTISVEDYSLLTDLYQLTMAGCYAGENLAQKRGSFELFVRQLPQGFGYLIAMGLAQVLDYLEKLHFSDIQIQALQETGIFERVPERFWSLLKSGGFVGDIWAVAEGTVMFANEPILRVEAPLWQAQLVETYILNAINYQTLIATKAARIRDVAGKESILLEFGTRRAFSPQASIWAARAALAGGFDATSNVLAALKLGRKPSGTMAHALVMAIGGLSGSEDEAFAAFQRYFPDSPLLIDTYDTVAAAHRLAEKVKRGEMEVRGVRLDSGDIAALSQKVRSAFRRNVSLSLLPDVKIFASGDIDEWEIVRLREAGGVIDGYGIGTKLVTGYPVNGVYKLVEIDSIPTMKQSSSKQTYPGRKQVFRRWGEGNIIPGDRLGLMWENPIDGETPLLELVMKEGQRIEEGERLDIICDRTTTSVTSLPRETRQLDNPIPISVQISDDLEKLTQKVLENWK
ncbi:MAG TPA: nicotinate phosphoribosyltransferase [Cyanobacteria bacterium UBA11149]|nr:nicotinate phosphoribosyltransferase [Cyanobacteria bacterium UBA11366]HBK62217.1 nicotinate phosphoribosyltransferase [Cyanobacteria bacterium UBA11166]HBR74304.1 nicotinate phosphoribosyltransferase [Cyanobacteria bacterium UBA11159]HBS68520.1 nicotinate phosphoribosyltransferase [Cyanobacteria bacterium UBA11153]HBW90704.1 nicotinate phosphoribosyltransferase [Cyanobacteria bacterium UBA11149]HCA94455.1 nicotinate phosphoribosyltransferase [Cyanobacteria bacterium UBA9226]